MSKLLKWYLPDSKGDGFVSKTSILCLGLLYCKGSTYDKGKVLYDMIPAKSSQ